MDFPKVWVLDPNSRTYQRDADGRQFGSPIWRESWREIRIDSETRVSWIAATGRKIPKKGGPGIAFSAADIDKQEFLKDNRYRISDLVGRCADYEVMLKIAALVGYRAP